MIAKAKKVCSLAKAVLCGLYYSLTAGIVAHELGHAFASSLLFKNAKPTVSLSFGGGRTSYHAGKLSPLGQTLGKARVFSLVCASGALSTLCISSLFLITAHCLKESQASNYLNGMAVISLFQELSYAADALYKKHLPAGHDFAALVRHGFSPWTPLVIGIAVPLCIKGLCIATEKLYKTLKKR